MKLVFLLFQNLLLQILKSRRRKYWLMWLILICLCGLNGLMFHMFLYNSTHKTGIVVDKQTIRSIRRNLNSIAHQLQINEQKHSWAKDSLEVLTNTIELLNTAETTKSITNKASGESVQFQREKMSKTVIVPDICPDTYVHANLSEPYFVNGSWVRVNCTTKDKQVKYLLTVLLYPPQSDTCTKDTNVLLQRIRKMHPGISIIVAVDVKTCTVKQKNIRILNIKSNVSMTWNKMVNKVTTKYMLFGRGLDNFSWLTRIERQLAVLANSHIYIVGGAFRNKTGHWEVGCYQSKLKFYQLIYTDGYYKSKNECMFCDYVKGPFIAKKSLFLKLSFDVFMTQNVIFEDFFLRMNQNDNVVVCPDAMYFATDETTSEKILNRTSWLPLVKKLELNRVVLPDNVKHRYTCEESGSSCKFLYSKVGRQYMPVCCIDRVVYSLTLFHEYCLHHNIRYYVDAGTALGAVKFRDVIPWDFDVDIKYYLANESFFESNKTPLAKENGTIYFDYFHLKWFGYFRINTPDFYIEMDGLNDTANEHVGMTKLFTKIPTKVRIRGEWFYGPPSPGLCARQQYGKELLKHANSWISQGHLWFDPYKIQYKFLKCSKPGHHSCYDASPTDGSFGLIVP